MKRPFECSETEITKHLDRLVDVTFDDLQSQFLVLPKGNNFVEFPEFQTAYEHLKSNTRAFDEITRDRVWSACVENALSFVVLRSILGFSPPEWADVAKDVTSETIPQGAARTLDSKARKETLYFKKMKESSVSAKRAKLLIDTAVELLKDGVETEAEQTVHRLNKVDTVAGKQSLQHAATSHVPYSMLLYERFLGRPFASHRDAVSELVGDLMESAIDKLLFDSQISFRRTGRAERIPGFDQAPDFFVPNESAPAAIIEAKIIGDDGTARDKVARILRLASMRDERERQKRPSFEVIACIDGRGFGVRRQDMKDMLIATKGKVFTLATLPQVLKHTVITKFLPK